MEEACNLLRGQRLQPSPIPDDWEDVEEAPELEPRHKNPEVLNPEPTLNPRPPEPRHGSQHGASTCRLFHGCDNLVREFGLEGDLKVPRFLAGNEAIKALSIPFKGLSRALTPPFPAKNQPVKVPRF